MVKKDSQLNEKLDNKGGKFKKLLKRIFIDIAISIGLIVVVYILLRPRTCCVTGTNRDVARRNDLSQIETAIENYKDISGIRPDLENAKKGTTVSSIGEILTKVGLSRGVWRDPWKENENYGLGDAKEEGEYLYMVTKKDGLENGGFILMASTEREGGSNRVVCKDGTGLEKGYITNDTDLKNIITCKTHTKGDSCSANTKACTYTTQEELRYILFH